MSTDRDVDRIVRSWLEEGVTSLPDRVLDDVLGQLPATPQRRSRWPAWRSNTMMTPLKIAAVVAAIGVLGVAVGIVPRTIGPAAPNVAASPSPSPSAAPMGGPGALVPGTYSDPLGSGRWTVTIPEGWEQYYGILFKDVDGQRTFTTIGGAGEVALGWWTVANVFADPCRWKDSLADPPVGPTVDDLVGAFLGQVGRDGAGPTDVVLAGLPAKRVELSVPADLDIATCDEGTYWEFLDYGESPTITAGADVDPAKPVVGGRTDVFYIMDIAGTRFMLRTWHEADASEQDLAELEAMLASIVIDLPAPSPAPSGSPGALAWSPASLEQDWPAPVRTEPAGDPVVVRWDGAYTDPAGDAGSSDAPRVDILRVKRSPCSSYGVCLDLAASDRSGPVGDSEPWIAYGLVYDTDMDGVADVRLGMDRFPAEHSPWGDTSGATDVRAWRTDLRAGTTESGRAGMSVCDCLTAEAGGGTAHIYPHQRIPGRFYAWASVIEDGRVVATDYAPDSGWLDPVP